MRYIRNNKTLGFKYSVDINDAPVSEISKQAIIKTENQLSDFSDYSWKDCPDTCRSTGAQIIFYQGGPIDHGTHVTGPVAQSILESEYNSACTSGMTLAHFRMLIHEFLNKNTDIVPEEAPLIILCSKSSVCMDNNGKKNNHTRHISRRVHLVRNVEIFKMHKIDWCEGGLQLSDIATKNVGEHYLTPIMKYIMVRLDK